MLGKLPNKFKFHQHLNDSLDNTFPCTGDYKGERGGVCTHWYADRKRSSIDTRFMKKLGTFTHRHL